MARVALYQQYDSRYAANHTGREREKPFYDDAKERRSEWHIRSYKPKDTYTVGASGRRDDLIEVVSDPQFPHCRRESPLVSKMAQYPLPSPCVLQRRYSEQAHRKK